MQHFPTLSQIENRASAIGVKPRALCAEARVSESSWSRWKDGAQEPLASKLRQVIEALERLERRQLEHLIALHPERAAELLAAQKQEAA
jgi:predicted transcriptional regulator